MSTKSTVNTYEPDFATPPGQTLLDKLEEMGMKQVKLALRIGLSQKHICGIINGSEPITQETAIGLERITGISARFWNDREAQYRERLARLNDLQQMNQDTAILNELPLRDLIRRGYVKKSTNDAEQLQSVLSFFGVKGVSELRNLWVSQKAAARKSQAFHEKPGYTAAWQRMGELQASQITCADFNKDKFRKAVEDIRKLTIKSSDEFVPLMQKLCAESGVALTLVPEIPSVCWFGASWWATSKKAIIELNLRGKKEDQFWFSFFHEARHILQEKKTTVFVEDKSLSDDLEKEANRFAANILIPEKHKPALLALKSHTDIQRFAEQLGISPGIVVGQYQHETGKYNFFNRLKKTFKWNDN